jgi:hypothetical protein
MGNRAISDDQVFRLSKLVQSVIDRRVGRVFSGGGMVGARISGLGRCGLFYTLYADLSRTMREHAQYGLRLHIWLDGTEFGALE